MYAKQMFVSVRMQLRNHVNTGSKAFQALQRICGIYTILNLDCC